MDHRYVDLRPETGIRTSSEADIGHLLDSWKQLLAINTGIRPKTGRGTGYREISGPNLLFWAVLEATNYVWSRIWAYLCCAYRV